MLIADSIGYMFLAWYIESVAPGEFGVAKKWYFLFTRAFWCGSDQKKDSNERLDCIQMETIGKNSSCGMIEPIDPADKLKIGIECVNLHKIYSRGFNHALRGLCVKFYENEISALLGHNGAGKPPLITDKTRIFY